MKQFGLQSIPVYQKEELAPLYSGLYEYRFKVE